MAVPRFSRLVSGLSLRRPGFAPVSINMRFVVDKMALGQLFIPSSSILHCQYHFTAFLHTYVSSGGWKICPLVTAVQRPSLTPSKSVSTKIQFEIQFIKGAGSAHHSPQCKHSVVLPYSVPLDEEFFDLCLQCPLRCCLFLLLNTTTHVRFHATNWSTAWGTVVSLVTVSQLPLPTTVVPTHINITKWNFRCVLKWTHCTKGADTPKLLLGFVV
jgi:hypothetical protein